MTDHVRIAARELRYLARVGAYRYLDAAYDDLRERGDVELPALDDDTGLVPCACARCLFGPGEKRRGHEVGALQVYADAEQVALEALGRLDDEDDVTPILEALKLGLDEGERVRAKLLSLDPRFQLIPGRACWLVTLQNALRLAQKGGAQARTTRPGVSGTPRATEPLPCSPSGAPAGVSLDEEA